MRGAALIVLAITVGVGPCAAAPEAQAREFTRTASVSGPVHLDVSTLAGGVTVSVGESSRVMVAGRLHVRPNLSGFNVTPADIERLRQAPPVSIAGNTVTLGPIVDERLRRAVAITFEVTVPKETEVRVETESGRVSIRGPNGPVRVVSHSGGVEVDDVRGAVDVTTSSGAIDLARVGGDVTARSGSGDVDVDGVQGGVTAKTQSSRIHARLLGLGSVDLSSGSGSVEITGARGPVAILTESSAIELEGRPEADWRAESGSGRISVRMPEGAAFSLDARSKSGRVRSAHSVASSGAADDRHVAGSVRGGGPAVTLVTRSSAITIE